MTEGRAATGASTECEKDENYLAETFKPAKGKPRVTDAFGHCSTLLIQKCLLFLAIDPLRAKWTTTDCCPSSSPTAQNQIFWVTDNDDPIQGTTQLFNVAMNKRKASFVVSGCCLYSAN